MPISFEIKKNPQDHDSDDVFMSGKYKGFGYKSKETGKIGLIKCPECGSVQFKYNGDCLSCGLTEESRNLINNYEN